jgi:rhodanese-related sulfurtransferase
MRFKITTLIIILVTILSCNNKQPGKTKTETGEINSVTAIEFKDKLKDYLLVDIRTPGEFAQGRIEGAININYYQRGFIEQFSEFDTTKPIFIYCRSGSRTSSAVKKLSNAGFKQVYELNGGIINWYRNKLKIVK